jgi:hypothetical protein
LGYNAIYMECHNEIPCIAILNKQKCHFFSQKRRTGRQNRSCLGGGYEWEGEDIRKGCRRVNVVEMLWTHV